MLAGPSRRAAATALVLVLAGCAPSHERTSDPRPPRDVVTATFDAARMDERLVIAGSIRASEEVTLTARSAARLTSLSARAGSRVRVGDPIGVFDAPEMHRQHAAARAALESASLAATVAVRQDARVESLFVAQVVSARERELAASQRRAAEAQLEAARAAMDAQDAARIVRAPFDGVVVRVHADPGADLQPGAPLAVVRSQAGRELEVQVPDQAVASLATAPLAVQIGDGPWRPARVVRLDGMTDPRTRSRTARIAFDGAAEPGAFARLAIGRVHDRAGAGGVPTASLVARGALRGVFVVEDGHARLRWLQLGREHGDQVQVLAGLESGERYVLAPDSLADGVAVRPRP